MTSVSPPHVDECARLRLAGSVVSLAAASPELGRLIQRPFLHLPPTTEPAELRIEAWTGEPVLPTGPDRIDSADGGAVITHVRPDACAVLERSHGRLRAWWVSEAAVPPQERTKPFLLCLTLWLADRGLTVAHAGGVSRGRRAVLLVGPSGSGKSTAALACAAHGFTFLGDDQVALGIEDGRPVVHSLFSTARIDGAYLALHPGLACGGPVVETGEIKPVLVLGESRAALAEKAEVAAIAVIRQGRDGLVRISRAAALRALAPSSLARMPLGPSAFHGLADIVASVPAVAIESTTPDAIPALVDLVLAGAAE